MGIMFKLIVLFCSVCVTNGFLIAPGVALNGLSGSPCLKTGSQHCYPGADCWPSQVEIARLQEKLDGDLLKPNDAEYDKLVIMKNLRVTKYPAFILVATSVDDVKLSLSWARARGMRVVVQSSGHDFQGRSTADGAFMVYLGNMTDISVNLNSSRADCPWGEVTVESGIQWQAVYRELDKYDRVMIGGSAHTVTIGGYTLGGGHSPISRMHGMAVDNLLEVEMVTADSRFVIANENGTTTIGADGRPSSYSPNTDLFWAVRGGGGGTFGIVTKFKFRLHQAPNKMVTFGCNFPMFLAAQKFNVAELVLEQFFSMLPDLPKQWGGYFFMSIVPYAGTNQIGTVSFYMNHFGDWNSPSRSYMDKLLHFRPDLQRPMTCGYTNRTSFWDYEKDSKDGLYYRNYVIGTLAQKESLNKSLSDFLINIISKPKQGSLTGFTGILLGGKMMDVGTTETSVHPGFRRALISAGVGAMWEGDGSTDDAFSDFMIAENEKIRVLGEGSYPNEATGKSPTWKTDFWGSNYARLEQIKRQWDPDNVFMCNQCVGWDHFQN